MGTIHRWVYLALTQSVSWSRAGCHWDMTPESPPWLIVFQPDHLPCPLFATRTIPSLYFWGCSFSYGSGKSLFKDRFSYLVLIWDLEFKPICLFGLFPIFIFIYIYIYLPPSLLILFQSPCVMFLFFLRVIWQTFWASNAGFFVRLLFSYFIRVARTIIGTLVQSHILSLEYSVESTYVVSARRIGLQP